MSDPVRVSLVVKEVPVELETPTGDVQTYTIKEITGPGRDEYLTFSTSKMKIGEDGTPIGMTDMKGMETKLLSLCLYDPANNLVPPEVIDSWPGSARAVLFKIAQDLSGLGTAAQKALEKAKNS